MGSSPVLTPRSPPQGARAAVPRAKLPRPLLLAAREGHARRREYLEAENAYTEAMSADIKPFSEALYQEMLGRIKQTDLSVPTRDRGLSTTTRRTVERAAVPDPLPQAGRRDGGYQEARPSRCCST